MSVSALRLLLEASREAWTAAGRYSGVASSLVKLGHVANAGALYKLALMCADAAEHYDREVIFRYGPGASQLATKP